MTEDREPVQSKFDDVLQKHVLMAQDVYDKRTAGDYTWHGIFYSFLDGYRSLVEDAWVRIEEGELGQERRSFEEENAQLRIGIDQQAVDIRILEAEIERLSKRRPTPPMEDPRIPRWKD